MKHDGGPAFPLPEEPGIHVSAPGMSLRDYFAAAALNGLISSWPHPPCGLVSERAYMIADAMLNERNKDGKTK